MSYGIQKKNSSSKVNNNNSNNVIKMNALEFMIHKHIKNVRSFFRCATSSQWKPKNSSSF